MSRDDFEDPNDANERRPARMQQLPGDEILYLRTLSVSARFIRMKALYDAGWTLRAIGESQTPQVTRSAVRYWINSVPRLGVVFPPTGEPAVPAPVYVTEAPRVPGAPAPARKRSGGSTGPRTRVIVSKLSADQEKEIGELAPIARKYRSALAPNHPVALANSRFNELIFELRDEGIPIAHIARAAGVTHRAIARRIEEHS